MILLILPNQLYLQHPGLKLKPSSIVLLEDSLFFGDPRCTKNFHKQKLWLHRATMKRYEAKLQDEGYATHYMDYDAEKPLLIDQLSQVIQRERAAVGKLCVVDPTDFVLKKRIVAACERLKLECEFLPSPGFINGAEENQEYRRGKKRWFMADFYKWQRQRLDVLIEEGEPVGGKWSWDDANRKKVPKKLLGAIPSNPTLKPDATDCEAREYVESRFAENLGSLAELYYPTSHRAAAQWLEHFLKHRFESFGDFEDAIVEGESWLWHSVLTPMLNVGLLTPKQIVDAALDYAAEHDVSLNSVEGFVRQIIGWREFMRATYEDIGVTMRTTNHWRHTRPMPKCFYDGSTGVAPIDDTIQRILKTGYCHHIERLMVLGGFMFLCEIGPDDIYGWFMEMFVDSYDWVMVPNVYAMSQNADGGLITTKPYFSGSSYVRKMSHYKSAEWCDVWDGLYWRWIGNHTEELGKNPRWAMMCSMFKKMDAETKRKHCANAEQFLKQLS